MTLVGPAVWSVYLGALVLLAVYGGHRLSLMARAARHRRSPGAPPAPSRAGAELPVVTVQLPLYNERAVAARVIAAAAALDWPRDRLELQVLDDSTDDTSALCAAAVAELRAAGVDAHHLRRADRTGFKAGALEAGRAVARGELLCVFDADFVPPPDFLRRTTAWFADPRVGLVQARWEHLNRAAGLLTELQALLLDGHFAIEQAGRAGSGACFNFNGTAGLWRATAIADAGGWHADTLTEDLDLSYRAALRGWRLVYAGDVTAPAELPADVLAFKSQQFRWAKGSVECARKLAPDVTRAGWRRRHRVEALFHLTHNLPYLVTLIAVLAGAAALAAGGGPAWAGPVHAVSAALTIAVVGGYVVLGQRALGRPVARALVRTPALIALTVGIALSQGRAVVEGLIGRRSGFVRTPKQGAVGDGRAPAAGRRYALRAGWTPWLELVMAAYLIACAGAAAARGAPWAGACLSWFALGVAAVAAGGLAAGWSRGAARAAVAENKRA